jgi:hypothetical protein
LFNTVHQSVAPLNQEADSSLVTIQSNFTKYHCYGTRKVGQPNIDGSHYYRLETILKDSLLPPFTESKGMNTFLTQKYFVLENVKPASHVLGVCDYSLYNFLRGLFHDTPSLISVPNLSGNMINPLFDTTGYVTTVRAVNQAAYDHGCKCLCTFVLLIIANNSE